MATFNWDNLITNLEKAFKKVDFAFEKNIFVEQSLETSVQEAVSGGGSVEDIETLICTAFHITKTDISALQEVESVVATTISDVASSTVQTPSRDLLMSGQWQRQRRSSRWTTLEPRRYSAS